MSMDPSLLPLLMALLTTLLSLTWSEFWSMSNPQATLSKSQHKLIIEREYNNYHTNMRA